MQLLSVLVIWVTITQLQCGVIFQGKAPECKDPECPSDCTIQTSNDSPCPVCECKDADEDVDLPIVRLKRSKRTVKCKLIEFSTKYLNSRRKMECDESEEEDEEDFADNDESSLEKEFTDEPLTNCRLRKFIGAYKVKNLNGNSELDCTEKEEEEDDLDADVGTQEFGKYALPKGCKLRMFTSAYASKNLNKQFEIVCDEEDEDEEDER